MVLHPIGMQRVPCHNLKDYASLWHIEATGAGCVSSWNNKVAASDLMCYGRLDIHFITLLFSVTCGICARSPTH